MNMKIDPESARTFETAAASVRAAFVEKKPMLPEMLATVRAMKAGADFAREVAKMPDVFRQAAVNWVAEFINDGESGKAASAWKKISGEK